MSIKQLEKKLNLNEKEIRNICAQEHMLKSVYKKNTLKSVDVEFKEDVFKLIMKISKELKVSKDAVIGGLLHSKIELDKK